MKEEITEALQDYGMKGYNCAQSILCAYAQEAGLDKETAFRLAEGLGGGVGGMQEVCGAFSAACIVISALSSDGKLEGSQTKGATYQTIQKAAQQFREQNGSIVCREILNGGKPQHGACGGKIRCAAQIVEQFLAQKEG